MKDKLQQFVCRFKNSDGRYLQTRIWNRFLNLSAANNDKVKNKKRRTLPRSHSDRITILEKRIRQAERYHNSTDYSICKNEHEELVGFLKEAKNDILKSIPLYSSEYWL